MDEVRFNKELVKIAPDLRLLYNRERKLWGIYQIGPSMLIVNGPVKPWLMWDCVDIDANNHKTFRLPDRTDLQRAWQSVVSGHKMFEKGSDWYVDKIEEQENARAAATRKKTDDDIRAAAHEVKFHTSVIMNKPSRHK